MTENSIYTTPTTPTTPVPLKCPAGWTEAQNKCYKVKYLKKNFKSIVFNLFTFISSYLIRQQISV
jgi:hypothetical protein